VNISEATSLLDQELACWRIISHRDLVHMVGTDKSVVVKGASGIDYVVNVEIDYVNEDHASIEVVAFIAERDGRRLLPPHVSASFTVHP
jgi:hypothetical protein